MHLAIAGVIIVVLLLVVGLASLARLIASNRGKRVQVIIEMECEELPLGRGWKVSTASVPRTEFIGATKSQAVGRAIAQVGRDLSVGVSV